jgi:serine/threonine protein kinase
MEIPPGTVIDDYTFLDTIGAGAFAVVYRVMSARFRTVFAAKVLRPDHGPSTRNHESYEAELSALKSLSHPNIILLFNTLKYQGCDVLVFEFCPHGSLKMEIAATRGRGLSLERFTAIAREVLDALDYCHSQGFAHCDIKPANILVDEYGRAKLADFGVADLFTNQRRSRHMGTIPYMAPELFQSQPGNRQPADVWALGVTFVQMLTGHLPWPDDPDEARGAIMMGCFQPGENWPPMLKQLIHKMLHPDPSVRWSAQKLRHHPFFTDGDGETLLGLAASPSMRRMNVRRDIVRPSLSMSLPKGRIGKIRPKAETPTLLLLDLIGGPLVAQPSFGYLGRRRSDEAGKT